MVVRRLILAAAVASWIVAIVAESLGQRVAGRYVLVPLAALGLLLLLRGLLAMAKPRERIVVVGSGEIGQRVIVSVQLAGKRLVGWVDDPVPGSHAAPGLTPLAALPDLLRTTDADRVIVAFSTQRDRDLLRVLRSCDDTGVELDIVPRLFDYLGAQARLHVIGDMPIVRVPRYRMGAVRRSAKRTFDLVAALALLVAVAPLCLVLAVVITLDDGLPVIYRQARCGRGGRPFTILKFRTMVRGADTAERDRLSSLAAGTISIDEAVNSLKPVHDPRITRAGRLLRRTCLDELPQLWNVVRGDMSLVGPRPLRDFEVEALDAWQLVRHDVRPGITGLWQVLARSGIRWDQRMQLDYTYVRHWSLATDLRILAQTIPAVWLRARRESEPIVIAARQGPPAAGGQRRRLSASRSS